MQTLRNIPPGAVLRCYVVSVVSDDDVGGDCVHRAEYDSGSTVTT